MLVSAMPPTNLCIDFTLEDLSGCGCDGVSGPLTSSSCLVFCWICLVSEATALRCCCSGPYRSKRSSEDSSDCCRDTWDIQWITTRMLTENNGSIKVYIHVLDQKSDV